MARAQYRKPGQRDRQQAADQQPVRAGIEAAIDTRRRQGHVPDQGLPAGQGECLSTCRRAGAIQATLEGLRTIADTTWRGEMPAAKSKDRSAAAESPATA